MKTRFYSDPECSKCGGMGVYPHEVTGGMVECECSRKARVIHMTAKAGFPSAYAGKRVNNYIPEAENKSEAQARIKIEAWVKGYERKCDGLVIAGSPGNGKTHLLVAIGNALIQIHGVQPLFTTASEFLRETKARFSMDAEKTGDADDAFEKAASASVLLMDDLGAERQTEWSVNLLCDLIDSRYAEGKTTLLTTNFAPAEIRKTYGDRFYDRLFDMADLVLIEGPSRRKGVKA